MKVADKSPKQSPSESPRATITLSRETYRMIDDLRGPESRSAWLKNLVERERNVRQREQLAALLKRQYTGPVCAETLRVNDEFPVQES